VAELASLTPDAFDLASDAPTVTVKVGYTKNRTLAVQPLPVDVADALAAYLAGKPVAKPVWPGTWTEKAAKMLRIDLGTAGVPYVTDGPEGPEYADFHALRHSYITNVVNSGVNVKTAQSLARHSTITLTMDRYTHVQLNDHAAAMEKMPTLVATPPTATEARLKATGTDDFACTNPCTKNAKTADFGRYGMGRSDTSMAQSDRVENPMNHGGFESNGTAWDGMNQVRPEGLEPPTCGSEDRCSIQLSYGREASKNLDKGHFPNTSKTSFTTDCALQPGQPWQRFAVNAVTLSRSHSPSPAPILCRPPSPASPPSLTRLFHIRRTRPATGAKKIRGKLHYFGKWADPDSALEEYHKVKDALHAGRKPRPDPEAITVKDVVNAFLNHKRDMKDAGELSPRTWDGYKRTGDPISSSSSVCRRRS
jgi:hypothetical protein